MGYELFIAWRYLRARRRQTAVSVITGIAILGIGVGVAALIIAQAVVTGFRGEVQDRILQGTAHLNLLREDNGPIEDSAALARRLAGISGVRAVAATSYVPVLLSLGDRQEQVILKGVDLAAPPEANELTTTMVEGDPSELGRQTDPPGLILGTELARLLGAERGDVVTALSVGTRLTPAGLQSRPRYTPLAVIGRFSSGLYEYDAKWGYVALGDALALTPTEGAGLGSASVIQMKVVDLNEVEAVAARVREAAGSGYLTTSWQELNRPLFAALQLQHRLIVIFFSLLIAVAALNIITALTMMVIEKNRDIAILRAQGATPRSIGWIFLLQGGMIGLIGAALGLGLGVSLSWLANALSLISLPAEIYSISSVTLRVQPLDCLWIGLLAIVITLVATIFPARAASRLAPVEAMRYE
ncbi:MAG: FtsX-like permease family protein [Blastocatellia bacterium]